MMQLLKIGTRESDLAVWQATQVQQLLKKQSVESELVFINSEGDVDLVTPLYEMGVQGIFTRTLDIALLNDRIDVAVHSMKDVPTQLPNGLQQAAVLPRASWKDLLVLRSDSAFMDDRYTTAVIATSSIRRRAQWLNKYPNHTLVNLRGNINTRLAKVKESEWHGAIFAAAGVDRINIRPENALELDWMLPAPAQGAIMVVCRSGDNFTAAACALFNDKETEICTKVERDFLRQLMGGCSTPIAGLCEVVNGEAQFRGNILSADGSKKITIEKSVTVENAGGLEIEAGKEILANGGKEIITRLMASNDL